MHARCTICQDTLDEANTPMSTLCGHLYCVECAAYQFANGGVCAICRTGPYELDALIKLFPDYEHAPAERPESSTRRSRRDAPQSSRAMEAGASALRACHDALDSEDPLDPHRVRSALERTDDLVAALDGVEAPGIQNLLSNIITLLQDIRSRTSETARVPDLESQRDLLQHAARRLTERIRDLQRSRDAERETAAEELAELRQEWATRMAELQEDLEQTTSLLNIERAKVEQSRVVITELDAEAKKWETQAGRYKKKHHSLKKKHQAMEAGIQDVFFGGDESLEFI